MPTTPTPQPTPHAAPPAPIDIGTPQGVSEAEQLMQQAIATNALREVFAMVTQGEEVLQKKQAMLQAEQPQLYERLQNMFARGQWFVLERMSPRTAEQLLEQHAEYFFEYSLAEVEEKIRGLLLAEPLWEERDKWRERFRTALMNATAPLGEQQIQVGGTAVQPEVGQWIRDFRDFLKHRKPNALLVLEYVNTSQNAALLPEEDRKKLESILKFYLSLHQSSLTAQGNEITMTVADPVSGKYKIFDRGQLIETDIDIAPEELKRMRQEAGLDEEGKPLSVAQQVKQSPALDQVDIQDPALEAELNTMMGLPTPPPATPPPATVVTPKKMTPPKPYTPSPIAQRILDAKKKQAEVHPISAGEVVRPVEETTPAPQPESPIAAVMQPAGPARQTAVQDQHIYTNVAQQVLRTYQLMFPTVDLEKRFLTLISSYLQGRRSRAEARLLLIKTPAEGGTHLPQKMSDDILETADYLLRQSYQQAQSSVRPTSEQPTIQLKPSFESLKQRIDAAKQAAERMDADHIPKQSHVEDVLAPVSAQFDPFSQPITDAPANLPQRRSKRVSDIMRPADQDQPVIMGPIEELGHFSVTEFRRLASDPRQAAQKVVQKIQLLEQESLLKRAQGIEAWKLSPLNQLYVRIGTRSFERTMSVDQVLAEMQSRGEEALTSDEFHAIAELNRQIRY